MIKHGQLNTQRKFSLINKINIFFNFAFFTVHHGNGKKYHQRLDFINWPPSLISKQASVSLMKGNKISNTF